LALNQFCGMVEHENASTMGKEKMVKRQTFCTLPLPIKRKMPLTGAPKNCQ
jgi:hypothetical protein